MESAQQKHEIENSMWYISNHEKKHYYIVVCYIASDCILRFFIQNTHIFWVSWRSPGYESVMVDRIFLQ